MRNMEIAGEFMDIFASTTRTNILPRVKRDCHRKSLR